MTTKRKTTRPGWLMPEATPRMDPPVWQNRPVSDLQLGPATTGLLAAAGYTTLGALDAAPDDALCAIKRVGPTTITKIRAAIAAWAWTPKGAV